MKKASLPNGQVLVFPADTSDEVIRNTVKRIVSSKNGDDWSAEHIKTVIRELTTAQGKIDMLKTEAESKRTSDEIQRSKSELEKLKVELEKARIDNFGPAIEKQNKTILSAIKDFVSEFKSSSADHNKAVITGFIPLIKDVVKEIVGLKNNIEKMSLKNDVAIKNLIETIADHGRLMLNVVRTQEETQDILKQLVESQIETTEALKKLAKVAGADRDIVRDTDGRMKSLVIKK